jgi:hypothetical protein
VKRFQANFDQGQSITLTFAQIDEAHFRALQQMRPPRLLGAANTPEKPAL